MIREWLYNPEALLKKIKIFELDQKIRGLKDQEIDEIFSSHIKGIASQSLEEPDAIEPLLKLQKSRLFNKEDFYSQVKEQYLVQIEEKNQLNNSQLLACQKSFPN